MARSAIAALTTGNAVAHLKQYLDTGTERYQVLEESGAGSDIARSFRFNDRIARALVAGKEGDHESAIDYLTRATNDRPLTEQQPIFTDHQVLEAYEYLYQSTGQDVYRERGYELAKRFQVIQPMYPWAYAFAASMAPDEALRIPELAIAMLLDPGSLRVSRMSDRERDAARAWLRNNGSPFRDPETDNDSSPTA